MQVELIDTENGYRIHLIPENGSDNYFIHSFDGEMVLAEVKDNELVIAIGYT